jgi:hypothetical protein
MPLGASAGFRVDVHAVLRQPGSTRAGTESDAVLFIELERFFVTSACICRRIVATPCVLNLGATTSMHVLVA